MLLFHSNDEFSVRKECSGAQAEPTAVSFSFNIGLLSDVLSAAFVAICVAPQGIIVRQYVQSDH